MHEWCAYHRDGRSDVNASHEHARKPAIDDVDASQAPRDYPSAIRANAADGRFSEAVAVPFIKAHPASHNRQPSQHDSTG